MRMPWGVADEVAALFLTGLDYSMIGCLSFEERCLAIPRAFSPRGGMTRTATLLEMEGDPDAFPNRLPEAARRIDDNRRALENCGARFNVTRRPLLAREDDLIRMYEDLSDELGDTVVLDITCLPKRYFCFMLKKLLIDGRRRNVVVTYAHAGSGYASGRLAEDPMLCDHLPGFPPLLTESDLIVISVGYESLNIYSSLVCSGCRSRTCRPHRSQIPT